LIIEKTNKVFTGLGHGWLRMPGQSASGQAFLAQPGAASTKGGTNHFIEMVCDHYQFRTNLATFAGAVEVHDLLGEQVQGTMNCGRMAITFKGTNELDRMVANDAVVIQHGTNRLTGGRAIYTGTNGLLELTDHPAWQAGPRQGKGDLVQVKQQPDEMFVRSNAWLRMPAETMGQTGVPGMSSTNRAASKSPTNQFADIFCQRYYLTQTGGHFQGGVHIRHPRVDWDCEDMTAHWPGEGSRLDRMVARRAVTFVATDENGQKTSGSGDEAVYTYAVTDGVTNSILNLTGNPATLVSTNGITFRNDVIRYDLGRQQLISGGGFSISSMPTNAAGSNTFQTPKTGPPRNGPPPGSPPDGIRPKGPPPR
jgi:lipopolysaccharide export system protein LptA